MLEQKEKIRVIYHIKYIMIVISGGNIWWFYLPIYEQG